MLVERTKFSHTYIKISSESLNRTLIYQANGSGVWFIGEDAFLHKNIPVEEYDFTITEVQKIKLLQFCVDNSGKSYGRMQLCGMGLCRLIKAVIGKSIKNPFGDENRRYICAELVANALNEVGFPEIKELDNIGLKELVEKVKQL
jgi:hypothetical protein